VNELPHGVIARRP